MGAMALLGKPPNYLTQVTCRLRLIESREVEEIRDLLELRQGKGARWFEQI
jgi:hypothetical protein